MVLFATDALAATGDVVADPAGSLGPYVATVAGLGWITALALYMRGSTLSIQDVFSSVLRIPLMTYLLLRERVVKILEKDGVLRKWEDAQVDLIDGWYEKGEITRRQRNWLYRYVGKATGNVGFRPKLALRAAIGNRLSRKGKWNDPYKPIPFPKEYTPPLRNTPMNEADRIAHGLAA